MSSRHEAEGGLSPRIRNALETVFGSKMELIVPERPKVSPWTISGKGVIVDFHPLPDGVRTWVNVTSSDGRSIMDMEIVPSEIVVEPNFDPQRVTIENQKGTIMIIPKDGEVVFKKPEVGI